LCLPEESVLLALKRAVLKIRSIIGSVGFEQSKTPEMRYYTLVNGALRMPDVLLQLGLN
jgi:hypothetical protein